MHSPSSLDFNSTNSSNVFNLSGSLDLTEDIILYLQDDRQTLHNLSLTCKSLAEPARRVLFESLKLMDDRSVGKWRVELQRLAVQPSTIPCGLQYVKDFAFSFDTKRDLHIINFIQSVQGIWTLNTIRVFGLDGLFCLPQDTWFPDFVKATQASMISFNGTHIADYILKFDCPSVRFIEFNYCRIYHISDELKTKGPRPCRLNAKVALRAEGKNWERVEKITSTSLNSETLNLVKDAAGWLNSLEVQVIFDSVDVTPEIELSNSVANIQSLCLQVPPVSLYAIPNLVKELVFRAPRLQYLMVYYEYGWYLACPWQKIHKQVMGSVSSALADTLQSSLQSVSFHFQDALYPPHIVLQEQSGPVSVSVEYDNKPPIHQGKKAQFGGSAYLLLGRGNLFTSDV